MTVGYSWLRKITGGRSLARVFRSCSPVNVPWPEQERFGWVGNAFVLFVPRLLVYALGAFPPSPTISRPFAMHPLLKIFLLGLTVGTMTTKAAEETAQPWASHEWTVESGVLWEIGHLTTIPYRLAPFQLSWMSRATFNHEFKDGSRLVLRHRITLLGDLILNGPESHYDGFSCSPSIEWWNKTGNWALYTGSGGGFGWIDSRGVTGGQGEDFTLNWFIRAGVEHVTTKNGRFNAGLMYQHMSNGGRTDPNPGIDAVGFMLGYTWGF